MTLSARILKNLTWIIQSLLFFKSHFVIILGLGLVAAFGRATQLGAFGQVTTVVHTFLEVAIQSARLLVFLYALGFTNIKRGFIRLQLLLTSRTTWKENWHTARQKMKKEWPSLFGNFIIYLLIAFIINALIDYATYQTCLYFKLKASNIISAGASEWVIILFFKNVSVIPFTLVFNALFLLWITNKTTFSSK